MRCAPAFHDVMTPSRVLLMIASSEDSTMAASSAVVSSGEAALAIDQLEKEKCRGALNKNAPAYAVSSVSASGAGAGLWPPSFSLPRARSRSPACDSSRDRQIG